MARRTWADLSPRTRGLLIAVGSVEGGLKLAALIDLARRPQAQVCGSRTVWALALVLVNSVGVLPVVYFRRGRRPAQRPLPAGSSTPV